MCRGEAQSKSGSGELFERSRHRMNRNIQVETSVARSFEVRRSIIVIRKGQAVKGYVNHAKMMGEIVVPGKRAK